MEVVVGGPSSFGFLLSVLLTETCAEGSLSPTFRFPVTFKPSTAAAEEEEETGRCGDDDAAGLDAEVDDEEAVDVEEAGEELSRLTNPAKSEVFFLGADVADPVVNVVDNTPAFVFGAIEACDPGSNNNATGGGGADFNCTFL